MMIPVEVTVKFTFNLNPADYDDNATVKQMLEVEAENISSRGISLEDYMGDSDKVSVYMVPVDYKLLVEFDY